MPATVRDRLVDPRTWAKALVVLILVSVAVYSPAAPPFDRVAAFFLGVTAMMTIEMLS
jgi:hypothetical protein